MLQTRRREKKRKEVDKINQEEWEEVSRKKVKRQRDVPTLVRS